jgi:hypothetical protein
MLSNSVTVCQPRGQCYPLLACAAHDRPPLWPRPEFQAEVRVRFPAVPDFLQLGPISLVSAIEELLGKKSSGPGLGDRDFGRWGSAALTARHPSARETWYQFRSVGQASSRTEAAHDVSCWDLICTNSLRRSIRRTSPVCAGPPAEASSRLADSLPLERLIGTTRCMFTTANRRTGV